MDFYGNESTWDRFVRETMFDFRYDYEPNEFYEIPEVIFGEPESISPLKANRQ